MLGKFHIRMISITIDKYYFTNMSLFIDLKPGKITFVHNVYC